jgi:hypothetical protein
LRVKLKDKVIETNEIKVVDGIVYFTNVVNGMFYHYKNIWCPLVDKRDKELLQKAMETGYVDLSIDYIDMDS